MESYKDTVLKTTSHGASSVQLTVLIIGLGPDRKSVV